MQPLHYDLRCPAAKDNSIAHAAVAQSNLDAAITMRSADTELQNTVELRATALEIGAPKPGITTPKEKTHDFEALFKKSFKRKIISAKIEKIRWQITLADLMQPFQYNLRYPAARDTSITHAAVAPSNLDAAITMRSADTESQNTKELRATVLEIGAPKPDHDAKGKTHDFEALFKKSFKRKIISAKIEKIRWQITLADLLQPFQYNLRYPAAKDNCITHAAVAPSKLEAAMTMRFATSSSKPASLDAHGNTKRHQSCSHYIAICNQRVKKRIESRTHEQPLNVAEHRGGTDSRSVRPQPHPPHTRGTFHRQPKPCYTEKHKVSCPGFPPKRNPCNINAAMTMRFATSGSNVK